MTRNAIINYIKKTIAKGYTPEQVRDALINAGHPPQEIDILLKTTIPTQHRTKLWIFAGIIFIIAVIVVILLITLSEEKAPSIKLTILETEIARNRPLMLNVQLINPKEKELTAEMDFLIFSQGGPLMSSKKKIATITNYLTNLPEQILIDLPAGKYQLLLKVKIGDYLMTEEIFFEVLIGAGVEEEIPGITTPYEQREEQAKGCIGGCDDYNACTKDECINNECVHTALTPCCGNKICEQGEDATNCAIDCRKTEEKTKKAGNAEQAARECEKIITITERDNCFEQAAKDFSASGVCSNINDDIKRDACYMSFALEGDYSICSRITNKYTKNSCQNLRRMSESIS